MLLRRFMVLTRKDPAAADKLHHDLDEHIHKRQQHLVDLANATKKPPAAEDQHGGQ